MKQQSFKLLTEFERITAEQIAVECGKSKPTKQNIKDAISMVNMWNKSRIKKVYAHGFNTMATLQNDVYAD